MLQKILLGIPCYKLGILVLIFQLIVEDKGHVRAKYDSLCDVVMETAAQCFAYLEWPVAEVAPVFGVVVVVGSFGIVVVVDDFVDVDVVAAAVVSFLIAVDTDDVVVVVVVVLKHRNPFDHDQFYSCLVDMQSLGFSMFFETSC